jgi:UDP-N-acetylmuramoyl-tripeptide--D-alanyl-D-alanine ligase
MRAVVSPLRRSIRKGRLAWRGRLLNCQAAFRRVGLRRVTFIAVTGSCGKTTTLALSDAVLSSKGKCCVGGGSRRWLVAETLIDIEASTKFCLQELHASFPGLVRESVRVLRPQIGVVTTIGDDHYKNYRSLEATAREKGQLVESLPRNGVAILNVDSPHIQDMATRTRARVMTIGLSQRADLRALDVSSVWPDRLSMKVAYCHETVRVETQLVGEHWVTSVLAAIAAGIVCGVDLQTCAQAVQTVEPVFGRYSVHVGYDGAVYVLDTHKAPLWTIARGFGFVRSARAPRKTIVFGTISDYAAKGGRVYRNAARGALEIADRVIFVGPQSGHVTKLRKGELQDRLFDFETSYQASAFIAGNTMAGELIYAKASIADHLERIMLSQLDEVVCWRERCGKRSSCMSCNKYRRPTPPPFGLAQVRCLAVPTL